MKPCPFCEVEIADEAGHCTACGRDVAAYEKATRWLDRMAPPAPAPTFATKCLAALLAALGCAAAITLLTFGFTGNFWDSLGAGVGTAVVLVGLAAIPMLGARLLRRGQTRSRNSAKGEEK